MHAWDWLGALGPNCAAHSCAPPKSRAACAADTPRSMTSRTASNLSAIDVDVLDAEGQTLQYAQAAAVHQADAEPIGVAQLRNEQPNLPLRQHLRHALRTCGGGDLLSGRAAHSTPCRTETADSPISVELGSPSTLPILVQTGENLALVLTGFPDSHMAASREGCASRATSEHRGGRDSRDLPAQGVTPTHSDSHTIVVSRNKPRHFV